MIAGASLTLADIALIVAGPSPVSVIVTAVLGALFGRWAQATDRRRDGYAAAAVSTLFAWAEYPIPDSPTDNR